MTQADTRQLLLIELLRQLQTAVAHCTAGLDVQRVHAARVAVRRLRAILRSLRDEVNPAAYWQLRFDLTNLGRALGEVRGADIRLQQIEELRGEGNPATAGDRAALHRLSARWAQQARTTLDRRIHAVSWRRRMQRIAAAIARDELLLLPVQPVNAAYRAMLCASLRETAHSLRNTHRNVRALHKQRIRIKSTRYVCEILAPHVDVDVHQVLSALNKAQDVLGELHDLSGLCDWLGSASQCGPLNECLAQLAIRRAKRCRKRYHRMQETLRNRLEDTADASCPGR